MRLAAETVRLDGDAAEARCDGLPIWHSQAVLIDDAGTRRWWTATSWQHLGRRSVQPATPRFGWGAGLRPDDLSQEMDRPTGYTMESVTRRFGAQGVKFPVDELNRLDARRDVAAASHIDYGDQEVTVDFRVVSRA